MGRLGKLMLLLGILLIFLVIFLFQFKELSTKFKGIALLGIIGGISLIVASKSVKILRGDQMGVLERLGTPKEFRDSGLNFIIPFIDEIIVYPKKRFNFEYRVKCFTRENPNESEDYRGILVTLKITAYVNFPREKRNIDELPEEKRREIKQKMPQATKELTHPLIIIRRNNIPTSEDGLKEYIGGIIEAITRSTVGEISYLQLITQKKEVEKKLREHLTDPEGELIKSGFSPKGLSIVISEIELPDELESKISLYEIEKQEAKAAPWEAEERVIHTVGAVCKALYPHLTVEEAIKKFEEEYKKEEKLKLAKELIEKEMAIKRGAFKHIHITGTSGDFAKIAAEITAGIVAGMDTIKRGRTEEKTEEKKEKRKEKKMSDAEVIAYVHKQYEKWKKNQK
jgi:regulator of protease activity HflC (stomatin/prohibitin superfamily)